MHTLLIRDALLLFASAGVGPAAGLALLCARFFSFGGSFSFCLCHNNSFFIILKVILAQFLENASNFDIIAV